VDHNAAFDPQARGPDNCPDGCGGEDIKGVAEAVRPADQIEEEGVRGAAVRKPCLACRGRSRRPGLGRSMARTLLRTKRAGDGWGRGLGLKGLLVAGPV
jgi:hypothetical protein